MKLEYKDSHQFIKLLLSLVNYMEKPSEKTIAKIALFIWRNDILRKEIWKVFLTGK